MSELKEIRDFLELPNCIMSELAKQYFGQLLKMVDELERRLRVSKSKEQAVRELMQAETFPEYWRKNIYLVIGECELRRG